jgi:exodeoxyribonuclease V alpha subunit
MKSETGQHLSGKIEKIVYQNPENGYTVIQLSTKDEAHAKVTVVGYFTHSFLAGQVTFEGAWQTHPTHGQQFFAKSMTNEESDVDAISEMLLARQLEGIGQSFAQKLLQKFGSELPEILETRPERIKEVPGIGKQRYQKILKSWKKYRDSHESMVFLMSHQMSMGLAAKIYDKYANNTIQHIEDDPYQLIQDIEGIGFQTADNVARSMAMSQDDPRRLEAGVLHSLQQATQYGHCGIEQKKLIWQTSRLLQVNESSIQTILEDMIEGKKVVQDQVKSLTCIFPNELYYQEQQIAKHFKRLMGSVPDAQTKNLHVLLDKAVNAENMVFSEEQLQAMERALEEKVFVITGGPGVGKTTIVRWLVKVFMQAKKEVALAAPTGRAAKRLTEITGVEAKTIHRLLEYDPYSKRFRFQEHSPLPYNVIILDEASMIDVPLCAAVLEAISDDARVIIVGDADQLASVGPGDVLRSLIQSQVVPCQLLNTIFRQKDSSRIVENAHRINHGMMPLIDVEGEQDFYWVNAENEDIQQQKMLKIITERVPLRFGCEPRHIQVLSPTNEGPLGVNTLNRLLQQALNPAAHAKAEVKHRDRVFREGDKVLQVVNDYEKNVFNGDIGYIKIVDSDLKRLTVVFDQQTVEYPIKEWDQLKLAYGITVHKSQGSEYPAVIVVMSMRQKMMLTRNLLYTAVSRGKSCVVVLCEKMALEQAVRTQTTSTRMNKLEEWLTDETIEF